MSITLGDASSKGTSGYTTGQILIGFAVVLLFVAIIIGLVYAFRRGTSVRPLNRATGLRLATAQDVEAGATAAVALSLPFGPTNLSVVPQAPKLSLLASGVYSAEASVTVSNTGASASDVTLTLEVANALGATSVFPLTVSVPSAETKRITFVQLFEVAAGTQPATMAMQVFSADEDVKLATTSTYMTAERVGKVV